MPTPLTRDAVRRAIQAAAAAFERARAHALRPHRLTPAQYDLLDLLERMRCGCCGEGECRCPASYLCQNDISDRVACSKGNVSALVQRLVAGGFASREPDPRDRRHNAVRITAAGREALARARPDVDASADRLLGAFSSDDAARLEALLDRVGCAEARAGIVTEGL